MPIIKNILMNLRKSTDGSCNPGHDEHHLGPLGVGHVGDGEHDGRETVKRDDNHDEAGEIETNNSIEDHEPAGDIICLPRHCGTPGNLQGDLQKDHLKMDC